MHAERVDEPGSFSYVLHGSAHVTDERNNTADICQNKHKVQTHTHTHVSSKEGLDEGHTQTVFPQI